MNIYFAVYNFTSAGMSGSDVYHYHLAMILRKHGHEVRSLSQHILEMQFIDGVAVCPVSQHIENQNWADIVITFPMPHKLCKIDKPTVIIKHNDGKEPFDFSKYKILYCGESVRRKLKMSCKADFVWNPVNRYYRTDKRGNPDGPWIVVNCNDNKGGHRLVELARMCPGVKFAGVLGVYGNQIKGDLPNLEYWPANHNMTEYYQRACGLLSLSQREGFPTVVMEAMSHGLPVLGIDCEGFNEVSRIHPDGTNIKDLARLLNNETPESAAFYHLGRVRSIFRAAEIEASRDETALLNFLLN